MSAPPSDVVKLFSQVVRTFREVFWLGSPDWSEVHYISPAYEEIWGRSCQSLYDDPGSWLAAVHPDDRDTARRAAEARGAGEYARSEFPEYRIVRPDGSIRWILTRAYPVLDQDGRVTSIAGTAEDITRHKEAEQALRAEQARTQQYLDVAGVLLIALDVNQKVTLINRRGCEVLGLPEAEILGENWFERFIPQQDTVKIQEVFRQIVSGELTSVETWENPVVRPDGSLRWIAWHNSILRDPDGAIIGLFSSGEDVTERRRDERSLLRQQRIIRLSNEIAHIFLTLPRGQTYAGVLDAICEATCSPSGFFGYIDEQGDLVCPPMRQELREGRPVPDESFVFRRSKWGGLWGRALQEKRSLVANEGLRAPPGHPPVGCAVAVPLTHRDQLIGLFCLANKRGGYTDEDRELLEGAAAQTAPVLRAVLDDERRRLEHALLEEQLRQAQKMEAIGRLAGGVAHDFNNLLTVINATAGFVAEDLPPADPRQEDIQAILEAGRRGARLTRQLLAFGRRQVLEPEVLDLNGVVRDLEGMIRRLIGEDIDLRIELADGLDPVSADRSQIDQVVMNLVVNARDALGSGGRIQVRTANVGLGGTRSLNGSMAPRVLLAVSDDGEGMSTEVQDRIFEPFFSTKEEGRGTGLGLSMVYGIVQQSGGDIRVRSGSGEGTTIEVLLPRVDLDAGGDSIESSPVEEPGAELILVVEDEAVVRKLVRRILESAGYSVLLAANGEEALVECERASHEIGLVLTDVVMPEMGGKELADRLARRWPDLKVLYMSGYTGQAIARRGSLDEGAWFISKPFEPAELVSKVRAVLASSGLHALPG
jgi:PAS domain S-box-containing protein